MRIKESIVVVRHSRKEGAKTKERKFKKDRKAQKKIN